MDKAEQNADTLAMGQTMPGSALPAADAETAGPGEKIGRFVILEKIGEGAMGVVLAAYDPELDRRVALKFLRPRAPASPEARRTAAAEAKARLLREAQAMARLRHPNVVTVYDVGTVGERVFVAMEYVERGSLRGELSRLRGEGELGWERALDLFVHAGRGLWAAHAAGLVHRDFKPDNVLVGEDGRVQVTDFGLVATAATPVEGLDAEAAATQVNPDSPLSERLTEAGTVVGTPLYMAPEQHEGKPTDARSDQFAFCVALYEALFGQLPFSGSSRETYVSAMSAGEIREPPADSTVPAWILRVLRRGLDPDPTKRFPSMKALLEDLDVDRHDRRIGERTRTFLVTVLGILWTAGPLALYPGETGPDSYGHLGIFMFDSAVLLVALGLGVWARETLSRTEYNQNFAKLVLVALTMDLVLVASGALLGLAPPVTHSLFILVWLATAVAAALMLEPRLWPTCLGYLGALLLAAARPELHHLAMGAGNIILTLNAVVIWRPSHWTLSRLRSPRAEM